VDEIDEHSFNGSNLNGYERLVSIYNSRHTYLICAIIEWNKVLEQRRHALPEVFDEIGQEFGFELLS